MKLSKLAVALFFSMRCKAWPHVDAGQLDLAPDRVGVTVGRVGSSK